MTDNVRPFYSHGIYLKKRPGLFVHDSHWKSEQVLRVLNRNGITVKTVAEVGCGAGELLRLLQQQWGEGVKFAGYEVSPQAYELCKQRRNATLSFHLSDFTNIEGKKDQSHPLHRCFRAY